MSCEHSKKSAEVIETTWLVGTFFDDLSALRRLVCDVVVGRNSGIMRRDANGAGAFVWSGKGGRDCGQLTR
jgi:hypothetical protein